MPCSSTAEHDKKCTDYSFGECRLPAAEPQFCRPVPRQPAFLMESLTREGLYTAGSDRQSNHNLSARYHLGPCIVLY